MTSQSSTQLYHTSDLSVYYMHVFIFAAAAMEISCQTVLVTVGDVIEDVISPTTEVAFLIRF